MCCGKGVLRDHPSPTRVERVCACGVPHGADGSIRSRDVSQVRREPIRDHRPARNQNLGGCDSNLLPVQRPHPGGGLQGAPGSERSAQGRGEQVG